MAVLRQSCSASFPALTGNPELLPSNAQTISHRHWSLLEEAAKQQQLNIQEGETLLLKAIQNQANSCSPRFKGKLFPQTAVASGHWHESKGRHAAGARPLLISFTSQTRH